MLLTRVVTTLKDYPLQRRFSLTLSSYDKLPMRELIGTTKVWWSNHRQ